MTKEKNMPPFMEEGLNTFKKFKYPGIDMEALQACSQKNMELISTAQKIATETTQSVMELQNQYIKSTFEQWNEHMKQGLSKAPLADKMAYPSEAAQAMMANTIKHAQAVNSVITKSNEILLESIQQRFQEGLDESINLLKTHKEHR